MEDKGESNLCSWRQDGPRFVGWLSKSPKVRADGRTFDEMSKALGNLVCEATGDAEAALDWDPPAPGTAVAADFYREQLYTLGPQGGARIQNTNDLFTKQRCPKCGWAGGIRTAATAMLSGIWARDIAGSSFENGASLLIASERFLNKFGSDQISDFEIRAVILPQGKRKKFFEIIPKQFVAHAAIRDWTTGGWRCSVCDRELFNYPKELGGWSRHIVARNRIPAKPGTGFFLGDPASVDVAIPKRKLDQLRNDGFGSQFVAQPLAVADDSIVIERPELREYGTQ